MPQKKLSETRKKIHEIYEQNEYADLKQNQNRARSFSVGTTVGGIIEVSMRADSASLWYLLYPVEVAEIIEQLASAAGLQVALRPKQDFTTWRSWDATSPDFSHWIGASPGQMTNEQREYLFAVKENNIRAIEETKKEVKSLTESKDESNNN
jgi:hypothetical protein